METALETNILLVQILVNPSSWVLWAIRNCGPFTNSLFSLNEAGDAVETRRSLQYIEQKDMQNKLYCIALANSHNKFKPNLYKYV